MDNWQTDLKRMRALIGTLLVAAGLTACGGGSADKAAGSTSGTATASAAAQDGLQVALGKKSNKDKGGATPAPPPTAASTEGRLLASNCFQCHGTGGTGGFDKIRGSEASEVLDYLTKTANRDIMAAHAQGYTRAQLQQIIVYLQQ